MGREGLIGAHSEVTEVARAQLDPLAGGVWRQQHLELFCHANPWTITLDMQLPPAAASVSAELRFPQLKMPFNSPAPKWRSLHGGSAGPWEFLPLLRPVTQWEAAVLNPHICAGSWGGSFLLLPLGLLWV